MKTKKAIPAVVIGGGLNGLAAIRSLGREGVPVYCLDNWKSEAGYSSYCKKCFVTPGISDSKDILRKSLLKLESLASHSVLFPTSDPIAMHMSILGEKLENYILTVPNKEILETLVNKRKFYESLAKQNVPHPVTASVEDYNTARKISENMAYPSFIKPSFSHQFYGMFKMKGFLAKSPKDLLKYLKLTTRANLEVMIQEIIPGPSTNHVFVDGYMDRQGSPKAFFARQRLRMWPSTFGNSTLCESIPMTQIILQKEILSRYLKSLDYSGIFSAEFKKDKRDGTFKLLEINPRTSAWFSTLSAKCGINLMLIAYLDAIGEDTEYIEQYKGGYRWLKLGTDILAASSMMLNAELTVPIWLSSLLRPKQEYFSFAKDDPYPFIRRLREAPAIFRKLAHARSIDLSMLLG